MDLVIFLVFSLGLMVGRVVTYDGWGPSTAMRS